MADQGPWLRFLLLCKRVVRTLRSVLVYCSLKSYNEGTLSQNLEKDKIPSNWHIYVWTKNDANNSTTKHGFAPLLYDGYPIISETGTISLELFVALERNFAWIIRNIIAMQKWRLMTLCYDVIIVDIYQKRSTSLGLRYNCNIDLERGCFFSIFHFSIYLFFNYRNVYWNLVI